MTKKKILLYGSVLVVFCIFWSVYVVLMFRGMDNSSQQSLRDSLGSAQLLMDKSLEYQAKELSYEVNSREEFTSGSFEGLYHALSSLPANEAEYYIAGEDGTLYTATGQTLTASINAATLRTADLEGYAYFPPPELSTLEGAGLVIPLSAQRDAYIVAFYSFEQFMDVITTSFPIANEYIALYNNWGTLLYGEGSFAQPEEVNSGAMVFATGSASEMVQAGSARQSYNVYVSLGQPAGWFVGLRTQAADAVPMYSSMVQTSILALVSWVLLIALIIVLDVTNDKEKKKELVKVSKTDALTGLTNSSGMEEEISNFFTHEEKLNYSLVVVDIVAFSRFNTMFGNVIGDSLLRTTADVLKENYSCSTRMGSDVFAFLVQTQPGIAADAEHRLMAAVREKLGEHYAPLIAYKFGVYPIRDADHTFREIYDGAIIALKDAKKIPEQAEVVFDDGLQKSVDLQRNIEINMLHAISKEEFLTYIQPKFTVRNEKCCGGEALVRWQSDEMGMLQPGQFIPLFEKNGFIVELDFYMLASILNIVKAEMKRGVGLFPLSVNLSRITLTFPNFLERISALVKNYPMVPLEYVEIEITESALENSSDAVIPLINELKALGFCIAMDDFGTGFSSLNTLRELPVDVLKIDKEFLSESDTSGRSRKIIRNITNMSKELGIKVVCEGVETATQLEFLKDAGCDIAQGFYFAKPMPLEQFETTYL